MKRLILKGNLYNSLVKRVFLLILLINSINLYSQTIPSTGSVTTPCGDCTPTGWFDTGGTPDISNRFITGGLETLGGGATWANAPLPLPPTGHTTWITLRDVGVGNGNVEESVTTKIGGLTAGRFYVVTIYALSALSNQDGGADNNLYYAGTYMDEFDYQINTEARQTISNVPRDQWGVAKSFFVGNPDANGEVQITLYPRTDGAYDGTLNTIGLEAVNIAIAVNAVDEVDTDGDGIPDAIDIDDDNDGILDTVELTSGGITYDPLGDEDGDRLPNYLDVRDDNGTSDGSTTDYNDINGDGIPDVYDFDNDGIPNHLDLDSDNDGIPDIIEAQSTAGYIAPNGVVGANGLDSAYENNDTASATGLGGASGSGLINTDSTGNPDYLDLDSDGDGVSDTIEANTNLSGIYGTNGLDNSYDNGDNYIDTNGSFDNSQTDNFPDTTVGGDVNWRDSGTALQRDTDGDGIPDSTDIDDDNDGILDTEEGFFICNGTFTSPVRQLGNGPVNDIQSLDLSSMGVSIGDQVIVSNVLADGDLSLG
ncbi:MAG: hypothetical protein HWD85_12650, partial [Flavobacteriaceae bacterium]|nr:hypothetical protein [Flavobacteriaceae bacterium]